MALPATDDFEAYTDEDSLGDQTNWTNVESVMRVIDGGSDARIITDHPSNSETCVRWNADTFADDQYSELVLDESSTGGLGVSTRCSSSASTYMGYYGNDINGMYLFKQVAGTWTQLGDTGSTVSDGTVVKLESESTTHTPYTDDTVDSSIGAQTDSAISSGDAGVAGWGLGNETIGNGDDWEGGDLADVLVADDITSGTPTLDSPTIAQTHVLTANEITSGTPTLDSPVIAQTHALVSTEITSGTPTLDSPTIYELQFASPISDISTGTWSPSSGSTLYEMIDEETPSDADYIFSDNDPVADTCEVRYAALVDPEVSDFHTIRYRIQKNGGGPGQLTFYLMEGTTQRATWTEGEVSSTVTEGSYTLSAAEADSITSYSDLRLRISANEGAFEDEFGDQSIASFWTQDTGTSGVLTETAAGNLQIEAGLGDAYPGDYDPTGVYQTLSGDFDVWGKWTIDQLTANHQMAILMAVVDASNWIWVGRIWWDLNCFRRHDIVSSSSYPGDRVASTDTTYWLRMKRVGSTFTCYYATTLPVVDIDWTEIDTHDTTTLSSSADVQLWLNATTDGGAQFTSDIEYFRKW